MIRLVILFIITVILYSSSHANRRKGVLQLNASSRRRGFHHRVHRHDHDPRVLHPNKVLIINYISLSSKSLISRGEVQPEFPAENPKMRGLNTLNTSWIPFMPHLNTPENLMNTLNTSPLGTSLIPFWGWLFQSNTNCAMENALRCLDAAPVWKVNR